MDRSLQSQNEGIPCGAKAGVGRKKISWRFYITCPVACNGKYTAGLTLVLLFHLLRIVVPVTSVNFSSAV